MLHMFIEPMDWMGDISAESGQLKCKGCALILGNYSWLGLGCSCGAHMSPAFRISSGLVLVRERPPSRASSKPRRFNPDAEPANSGTPVSALGSAFNDDGFLVEK